MALTGAEAQQRYRANNRERVREANRQYRIDHPAIMRCSYATSRARKLNAVPDWVSKEELQAVYDNCPAGYEVDHIEPLKGKFVCGLHVPWNLQYLTKSENIRKSLSGEGQPRSKLTENNVIEIRKMLDHGGDTHEAIACCFGVSRQLIDRIATGTIWRNI